MNQINNDDVDDQQQNNTIEQEEEIDTSCGFGPCKKIKFLNKLANKNSYVIIYGLLGCMYGATYSYGNSTISTLEKRFKIPSRYTGYISVGNDISSLLASLFLSYYAGKGHRPRWLAAGIYTVVLYCFINLVPHILWGPGEDALSLTLEHQIAPDENKTIEILLAQKRKTLCRTLEDGGAVAGTECLIPGASKEHGSLAAFIFFMANFISGIGGSLYYTLGVSYMDDNVKKSKTPLLASISYFMRMLAPALGYSLGSYFLKMYISPSMTPTITNSDPRWLGAWWGGWVLLGFALIIFGSIMGMFPRALPKTVQRKREVQEKKKDTKTTTDLLFGGGDESDDKPSFKDMSKTVKRLLRNKIYMCNTIAGIFYMFGFMPYWIYTPKYIEVQYHTSASRASFFTGSVGLVFSAIGVLVSGIVITKFQPNARYLAGWNVIVSCIAIAGTITYSFLGCEPSDIMSKQMAQHIVRQDCNTHCLCDFVKYSPICSEDGRTTFISPCHAGCRDQIFQDGKKVFIDCSCISESNVSSWKIEEEHNNSNSVGGRANSGHCPLDCSSHFYIFIVVVCILKFTGATGRTSNFLVSVRCVSEKDKATSLGFASMLFSLFVFIPSPIVFSYIIDSTCVVWGKTCSGTGNCWQYDGETLRVLLNYTASVFITIGTLFDVGTWYYVKDLMIFDEENNENENKNDEDEEAGKELLEMATHHPIVDEPEE